MRSPSLNHVYRLVWSAVTQAWVAVSEITKGKGKGKGKGKSKSQKAAAILSSALFAGFTGFTGFAGFAGFAGFSSFALAEPTGGVVTSGSGTISQSGTTTTINQSSQTLNLNWNSFNVGSKETVNFIQPSTTALAVNRILDTNGSRIMGNINANGQVWLINPNGVYFGSSATINVGSLLASTLNPLSNSTDTTQVFGNGGTGSVTNAGTINAADGGYVALIANTVSNTGTITANTGTVALGAGSQVSVTFADNQLLSLTVDKSTLNNLAENKGLLQANGGVVLLSAGAKDSLLASVVNNEGVIEAKTVDHQAGKIILMGGMTAGTTKVAGTLDASAETGDGGFIETSAHNVNIADGTTVTTQALNGESGTWLIDPLDFTITSGSAAETSTGIGASTLSSNLGRGNVTITTVNSSGTENGDINVNGAVSWTMSNTLTLSAYRNININNTITASGANGKVALRYGQGSVDGTINGTQASYNFGLTGTGFKGKINLRAGNNFSTMLGSGGATTDYRVITSLGSAGSITGTDLQGINGNLSGNFVLGTDINASNTSGWNSGAGFNPLGNSTTKFTGKFDGLGHTISNLKIYRPNTNYVGLFGYANDASLQNVGLISGSITGGDYVGGLAGRVNGSINATFVSLDVFGSNNIGGLVGVNDASISNAYTTAGAGGVGSYIGGLVGTNNGTINNAYATGLAGGASSSQVGGLVGVNTGTLSNVYATAEVNGIDELGGLVGVNHNIINGAYATGAVIGVSYLGGLVGTNKGGISNAYSTSTVNGNSFVGGLVGQMPSKEASVFIKNAYATGRVSGGARSGGLVGDTTVYSTIINSYYADTTGKLGRGDKMTIADLASVLPTGFDSAIWGNGDNQTTPYLLSMAGFDTAGSVYLKADATASSPYKVVLNLNQLQAINNDLSSNYVLGNNIDASATETWNSDNATNPTYAGFNPLGTYDANDASKAFSGNFDGLGHSISGLTINRPSTESVGLFGYANGASIRNVGLLDSSVTGGGYVGSLIGRAMNSTISDTYSTGTVTGSVNYVGGLIGYIIKGTITNAYTTGAVAGNNYVGGLVGYSIGLDNVISKVYASGAVTGHWYVGGLLGENSNYSSIVNAYATGAVKGGAYVGALVGKNALAGDISYAYATGVVSEGSSGGGFVGDNAGTVSASHYFVAASKSGATDNTDPALMQLSTYVGWDISANGGENTVWRIYEGQTGPLLRSFLTQVNLNGLTTTYNGQTQNAGSAPTGLDNTHLFGNAASGRNAGSYKTGYYSDQQGYDLIGGDLIIDKKALTITGTTAANKTYDGKTTATATAGTVTGFVDNETLNVSVASANFADKNAGKAKAVTVNYALTDGDNGGLSSNYSLANSVVYADINKATLTYVANAASSTSANMSAGRTPTLTGTVTGFVEGDTLANSTTGTLTWSLTGRPRLAGKYAITGSGLSSDNYDFVQALTNSTAFTVRVK